MSCKYHRCDIMKKIWIVGLMVFSLFAVSMNFVVADDEITLTDETGDVYDLYSYDEDAYVTHSENIVVDNIDISSLTYSRNGKIITLRLQVVGNIENRGDINDLLYEGTEAVDVTAYLLSLLTDNQYYVIYYANNKCQLTYYEDLSEEGGDAENITDFSVEDDLLTVSFELNSTEETYEEVLATSMYMYSPDLSDIEDIDYDDISDLSELGWEYLADEIYSESDTENDDTGDAGDQDTGDDNSSGGTDNTTFLFFIAIIAAICIIGVAVLIFIIRR